MPTRHLGKSHRQRLEYQACDPMPALALSLGRMLIFYVPMALLGNALFGYQGIFGAAALANVIMGVLSVWWMKRYLKRLIPADER